MERKTRESCPIFYRLKIVEKASDSGKIQIVYNRVRMANFFADHTNCSLLLLYRENQFPLYTLFPAVAAFPIFL